MGYGKKPGQVKKDRQGTARNLPETHKKMLKSHKGLCKAAIALIVQMRKEKNQSQKVLALSEKYRDSIHRSARTGEVCKSAKHLFDRMPSTY